MNPHPGIEVLPNGQWIVEGDTHLGAWAKQKGDIVTDPHLFQFLDPYLKDVETAWSIGANIGDHALHYVRQGKRVVAIEAHPITFECLRHNVPEALCLNLAASDVRGSVNLMTCENIGASRIRPDGEWSIEAVPLDDHPDLPTPGFIECDIEGWEPMALTGMAGTITRHKPILMFEMNRGALAANGCTPEALDEQIRSLGYREAILYPAKAKWSDDQLDALYIPE
jgi:FkbM family methyltransferase